MKNTTTAHRFWDTQWSDAEARQPWEIPEERVTKAVQEIRQNLEHPGAFCALDLGCGAGRHTLLLAEAGFTVRACDASPASVDLVTQKTKGFLKPPVEVLLAQMTNLPYGSESLDFVLSWNVLYHGDYQDLTQGVQEVLRVLRPGARLQLTLISKNNPHFGQGTSLDPYTWIQEAESDKSHPHCYLNDQDIKEVFQNFEILKQEEYLQNNYEGAWHWHLILQKKETQS